MKQQSTDARIPLRARMMAPIARVPEWARPAFAGPLILVYAIFLRGGFIVIPVVAYEFIKHGVAFLPQFETGVELFLVILFAAALGGLAYGVVGRPLRSVPGIGRYLAGIVAIAPYMAGVALLVNATDRGSLWAPWDGGDWFTFGLMTLLFGSVIGHSWFKPDPGHSEAESS